MSYLCIRWHIMLITDYLDRGRDRSDFSAIDYLYFYRMGIDPASVRPCVRACVRL